MNPTVNPNDRKKLLITQGAIYRAEVLHGVRGVRAGLRPNSLARGAFGKLATVALSLFGSKAGARLTGAGASALLPLLPRVAALLFRKSSSLKPVLRGTLIAGVIVAVAAWAVKTKSSNASKPRGR